MKFYPPVQEDVNKSDDEPTISQRLGGDVIVVRVGANSVSKKKIHLAANAIRATHNKRIKN
jgi:hypothetical protein